MTRDQGETSEIPILASADALEAVPGYTLIKFLGEGALARAYECRAERTGEIVVVKVFSKSASLDRANVQRVLRESRVVAGLRNHPHIARILDVGEAPAGPYVVFERLKGTDLRTKLLNGGRLTVGDAVAAVRDAARALEAASAVGVAHRDLKPSNLFVLEDGTVKVTDFGFAGPLARLGGPEGVYGTPAFVAPELLRGSPADVKTDIYALGATLFQLITARPLFEGSTADVLAAHQKKPVPSIATLVPDAGIVVVDILYRLLQKDTARRPQTAAEAVKLLDEGATRTASTRTSPPQPAPAAQPAPRVDPRAATRISALPPVPPPGRPRQEIAPESPAPSPFDQVESSGVVENPYVGQPTGVMGTLKQMSVTEIIQMLEIGKKSARIDVQTMDGLKGTLHVHDGQIVHCSTAGAGGASAGAGEPAVVQLCLRKEGFFRIHYEKEPCEKNVTRPTTFVLLEAMRQIDEASSAAAPAAAPAASPPAAAKAAPPSPASPAAPAARAAPQPPPNVPAVRKSPAPLAPRPSLARPRDPSNPEAAALGDGIQWQDATNEAAMSGVDDPTLPDVGRNDGARAAAPRAHARGPAGDGAGLAEKLKPHLESATRAAQALLVKADEALEPLRPTLTRVHPALGELRPVVVVGVVVGAIFALVLGVASALGTSGGDVAAILDGDADDVIDALEHVPPAQRTLAQDLVLGHAYAATLQDDLALEMYAAAVPAGVVDPLALGFLLSRLDASSPDDEMDLLVLWPDADAPTDVEDDLVPLTVDPRRYVRGNAVAVLVERGAIGRLDVERTAMLDVLDGPCGARRTALQVLRVAGSSPAAARALERAGEKASTCFSSGDVRAAIDVVMRRVEAGRVKD